MAPKITPGTIPTLTVGGRTFTDLANLKRLVTISAAGANLNATFREPAGSAGYQVPVGKTFKCLAVETRSSTVTPAGAYAGRLLYSDNDVGLGSAVAYTNPVYVGGGAGPASLGNSSQIAEPGLVKFEEAVQFDVPAGKYPGFLGISGAAACQAILYGYEV